MVLHGILVASQEVPTHTFAQTSDAGGAAFRRAQRVEVQDVAVVAVATAFGPCTTRGSRGVRCHYIRLSCLRSQVHGRLLAFGFGGDLRARRTGIARPHNLVICTKKPREGWVDRNKEVYIWVGGNGRCALCHELRSPGVLSGVTNI